VERPSFDGLEMLLVLSTPETMTVKLGGGTGPFSRSVLPRSLCGKLSRSHFLRGQTFGKFSLQGNATLKKKRYVNLFDLEQTCAHISLKRTFTNVHMGKISYYLYQHIRIFKTF